MFRRVDASMLHLHVTSVCTRGVPSREEVESTFGDRRLDGPPVNMRDSTFARAFLDFYATRVVYATTWHEATRRDATRRNARRGEVRRSDATRPFDVELALHGGRDNVARVHSPSLWLSRRVSLFRVRTRDERAAIRETQIATVPRIYPEIVGDTIYLDIANWYR